MEQITGITDEYRQNFQVLAPDGETVDINLYYYITQQSWYFDFKYKNYECNGMKIVLSPNALRHLKNIIPFGIGFISDDLVEPIFVDDFASNRVKMIMLNAGEVQEVESNIYAA